MITISRHLKRRCVKGSQPKLTSVTVEYIGLPCAYGPF